MTDHREGEPVDVLLVEDNPGDIRLAEEAFEQGCFNNVLHVVTDGAEALDFLFQRGDHRDASRPHLVLLDLTLPKVDGREVLEAVESDPGLESIPVVVLTGSVAEQDLVRGDELGSAATLAKPVSPDDFMDIVRAVDAFRFTIVRLPPNAA